MPTASAKPPRVMVLSVWPPIYMMSTAMMIDSGIEARMMSVNRQLPRNNKIMSAVRPAAIAPPMTTLLSAAFTNNDWSKMALMVTPAGMTFRMSSNASRTPSITASVETPPVLRIVMSAPGVPLTDTELVCTWNPSCTCATSRIKTDLPSTCLIGNWLSSSMTLGLLFIESV